MKLAQDRFYKSDCIKLFTMHGKTHKTPYDRYTYETVTTLYDVDIRRGDKSKSYHVNMGFETEAKPIHRQIEKHFGI